MTDTRELDDVDPLVVAERIATETLLNCYARELATGALWDRPPAHDPALRACWDAAGRSHWWRLPLDATGLDLFAPLAHVSATGRHRLAGPVRVRRRAGVELVEVGLLGLFDLLIAEYRGRARLSDDTAARLRARLAESCANLADILDHHRGWVPATDHFLPAEQGLWVGHPYHPLAKSRWGWSLDEVRRYSPEYGGEFALCFFLADPAVVIADHAGGGSGDPHAVLRHELLADPDLAPAARAALAAHPDWRLLPVHPWEDAHLRGDPAVQAALARGVLIALGAGGRPFTATSSVRTVYRADLPFQLKLSLHVAITNNQRVNQLHELKKGVAVARLLDSPLGRRLLGELPALQVLRDPGYVAVAIDGQVIDGFSTTIRDNPFHGDERVAVIGALCEPAQYGPAPLRRLIAEAADAGGTTLAVAALAWFERYLGLLLPITVTAHDRYGLALEVHLQNLGVALGPDAMPRGLFFRDNQGFFVRHGRAAALLDHSPGLADAGTCVLPERLVHDPIRYYLLVNNVLGVIQALGADGLADEDALVQVLDRRLRAVAATDDSGLVRDVVDARAWPAKGNLRMVLEDQDELLRPVEDPAPYVDVDNPILPVRHLARPVVAPIGHDVVHRRVFPEYGVPLALRPLDLDRDLAVLHDWYNQPYARAFWQQHGPLRELEAWYVELLASPYQHAFLGSFGDTPCFVVETYWAPRDVVGRHYPVQPGDHGFHALVAPPRTRLPRFTRRCFQVATELLLLHPEVDRVIAEPDHRNADAIRIFAATGFADHGEVELPDKRARLLSCTRTSLLDACPDARPFVTAQPRAVA